MTPLEAIAQLERRVAALEARLAELDAGPPPARGRRFVPVAEAAARSGLDKATLRRLLREGRLAGRRQVIPGSERGRWVVAECSLEDLIGEAETFASTTDATARPSRAQRAARG